MPNIIYKSLNRGLKSPYPQLEWLAIICIGSSQSAINPKGTLNYDINTLITTPPSKINIFCLNVYTLNHYWKLNSINYHLLSIYDISVVTLR